MMNKALTLLLITMTLNAQAALIDLSSWSELTLDFPGGQPVADCFLSGDNKSVEQVINAAPSMDLNNLNISKKFISMDQWKEYPLLRYFP